MNALNPNIKKRKGLLTYYKTYGIITLKNHVNIDHGIIAKKIEKEMNNLIKRLMERQLVKKRPSMFGSAISNFSNVRNHLENYVQDFQLTF
jgi:hypothetical protein